MTSEKLKEARGLENEILELERLLHKNTILYYIEIRTGGTGKEIKRSICIDEDSEIQQAIKDVYSKRLMKLQEKFATL